MSVPAEMPAAEPKLLSSTVSEIAIALFIGAIIVALILSISIGGGPQLAEYLGAATFP